MQTRVEWLSGGVDTFEAGRFELLAQLAVDEDQRLVDDVVRRRGGPTGHDPVEVIEDIEQPDGQRGLGAVGNLITLARYPLAEVVELGGEPELTVTGLSQLTFKPPNGFS